MYYLKFALRYLEKFGFNILPLRGKRPVIEWKRWQNNKQNRDDIERMPWANSTGLGAVMGNDDLRLLDIDGIEDYELLDQLLMDLGLPEKYTWVVQSGSGEGFHIYFLCKYKKEVFQKLGGEKAVYKFKLKKDGLCKHIELRSKDCQTALPPSMHESSGVYTYYYSEPNEAPEYIEAETLVTCLEKLCVIIEPSMENTATPVKQYYDTERLESALDFLSENLPDGCYEDWYRIGFALVPLGEKGENYFVELSLNNPNYADTEIVIRKKYKELVKDYDGRIAPGTIFHIAEEYGWKKPVVHFWFLDEHQRIKISRTRFKRFLESEGYCKLKKYSSYLFIKIIDSIVEEVDLIQIKDFVLGYLYTLPADEFEDISRSEIIDALIKGANQYFSNQFLEFLITRRIDFKRDTAKEGYLFYENGYVTVTENKRFINDYKEMDGFIWGKQIIKRKYHPTKLRSDFEELMHNTCRKDVQRTRAQKSGIGYLLHSYKDPNNAKAILFIDEQSSEGAYGRSGKGLVIKAISKIRNVVVEDGRNFDVGKNFAFQRVNADTNIVAIEDIREKFPFDRLFSIITEGITIEKKNKDEIFISFSESPKIVISSNFSIKGIDDSTKDRQFIVEFSDHYNKKNRPVHEFGKPFFEGWTELEWQAFDNLMIECLELYLKYGLVEYDYVNLERKQLIVETCTEFAEFSDDIHLDQEYNKRELCEKFKREYNDFLNLTQRKFTVWLKKWARIKNYDVIEGKSGVNRTIIFSAMKRAA